MTLYFAVAAAAANGIRTALDASNRAARVRADFVGSSIAALVPATWNGAGAVPIGWTIPMGELVEPGGARVAFAGTEAFAAGKPQFNGASNSMPPDWIK